MVKNSHMARCCQNRDCKGTGPNYGLHSHASTFAHSASITALKKKKKELVQNSVFAIFRLSTENILTIVINGFWQKQAYSLMLPSYLFLGVTHLIAEFQLFYA